jgi:hypothetical protein
VARSPEPEPILSREELADYARRLSLLSVSSVEDVYQTAHRDCAYTGKVLPPAAAVQQLVCAWRVLRRIHRAK